MSLNEIERFEVIRRGVPRVLGRLLMVLNLWDLGTARAQPAAAAPRLERIRISSDHRHFVLERSGKPFVIWGVNYDRDESGRLLEDYWEKEWATVEEDFREIQALGANVVRVHLQLGRFMMRPDQPNQAHLERLARLVDLAEQRGLYLDVTGLGCYHKQDVPEWYDALGESARWEVQARFWIAVASVCRSSPAVFCYDLMNEPVCGKGKGPRDWLAGEPLGGKYFVQRITTDPGSRTNEEVARAWVARLASAIRSVDRQTLITVGVIPWAFVFKGAKPLFYEPKVGGPLDFVSIHVYPKKGALAEELEALKAYDVGKPLVVEEIFPLAAGYEETAEFIERSRKLASGWISFYWGRTVAEYEKKGDLPSALVAGWLRRFQALGEVMKKPDGVSVPGSPEEGGR